MVNRNKIHNSAPYMAGGTNLLRNYLAGQRACGVRDSQTIDPTSKYMYLHDEGMTWKRFPHYRPFGKCIVLVSSRWSTHDIHSYPKKRCRDITTRYGSCTVTYVSQYVTLIWGHDQRPSAHCPPSALVSYFQATFSDCWLSYPLWNWWMSLDFTDVKSTPV